MSREHLDRKELKRPDAFLAQASHAVNFINQNAKLIMVAIAVLLVAGAAFATFTKVQAERDEKADAAFYSAQRSLQQSLEKVSKTDTDWEAKAKEGLAKVQAVTKDHKGTRSSFEAFLALGNVYLEHGNALKALEYFKQGIDASKGRVMKAAALHAAAYAYENTKQYDNAIDSMRQVVASEVTGLKGDALISLARNYELKGDQAKALEYYNQVIKDLPNTAWAKLAEMQKGK